MKTTIAGSALIAIMCAALLPHQAQADDAEVQRTEKIVSDYESQYGTNNGSISGLLFSLACTYQRNGKREKAEATYQRILSILQKQPGAASTVPEMMLSWSGLLAQSPRVYSLEEPSSSDAVERAQKREEELHKLDLAKAAQIDKEALALFDSLPNTNMQRLRAYATVIDRERSSGQFAEADTEEHRLQAILRQIEPGITDRGQITGLALLYDSLSNSHSSYGDHQNGAGTLRRDSEKALPAKHPFNASTHSGRPVAQTDYETAEELKLKALSFWDKLPNNDVQRIRANRDMVAWYKRFGESYQAEEQTKQLSKLLGSSDPNVLFPAHPPCPACGMG